ncbi:MAG: phosphatidylglycerophosphatase A [Kordiimonas sp.]|nr:phosphatidylglycerophosphatase A [Kordiimonas sp.]
MNASPSQWPSAYRHPAFWFATWFGAGLTPKAPGTWGSLAALPFAWVIMEQGGHYALMIAITLVFFIGLWASKVFMKKTGQSDPGQIVIDEVVGQWIACLPIASGPNLPEFVLALVSFRMFDIYKPWPVSIFDKKDHSAFGVMMDDVIAGFMAALVMVGFYVFIR